MKYSLISKTNILMMEKCWTCAEGRLARDLQQESLTHYPSHRSHIYIEDLYLEFTSFLWHWASRQHTTRVYNYVIYTTYIGIYIGVLYVCYMLCHKCVMFIVLLTFIYFYQMILLSVNKCWGGIECFCLQLRFPGNNLSSQCFSSLRDPSSSVIGWVMGFNDVQWLSTIMLPIATGQILSNM